MKSAAIIRRMMKITSAFAFLCIHFSSSAQLFTLPSLLDSVDANHPMLKMYDAEIRSMNDAAEGARALEAPTLGAGLWQAPYNTSMWRDSEMQPGQGMLMLSAEQMIMNPRKRRAEYDFMKSMANVETAMRGSARAELRYEARSNYYDLVVLQRKEALLQENIELMQYMLDVMETRFASGMDRVGGYYQVLASLRQAEAMIEMNIGRQRAALQALNALMLRPSSSTITIDTAIVLRDAFALIKDTSDIQAFSSSVAASRQQIELFRSQQRFARSRALPDLGIRFDHMMPFGSMPDQFTLMGMITLPIAPWSSGSYRSAVRSLDNAIEAERFQQQTLIAETAGMFNSMSERFAGMKRQVELYAQQVLPVLRKGLNTTLAAFAENAASTADVLNAWEAYQMSSLTYLDQLQEVLQMQAELEKILEE